jgi:predicted kinase
MSMIVLCGPARSGKSTWTKNFVESHKYEIWIVVNADKIRLALHGKRYLAERETEVHQITTIMVKVLLEQGVNLILDETNTTIEGVRKWLRLDPLAKFVFMNTPRDTCVERAYATEQPDLADYGVIDHMFDNLLNMCKYGTNGAGGISDTNVWYGIEKIRKEVFEELKLCYNTRLKNKEIPYFLSINPNQSVNYMLSSIHTIE